MKTKTRWMIGSALVALFSGALIGTPQAQAAETTWVCSVDLGNNDPRLVALLLDYFNTDSFDALAGMFDVTVVAPTEVQPGDAIAGQITTDIVLPFAIDIPGEIVATDPVTTVRAVGAGVDYPVGALYPDVAIAAPFPENSVFSAGTKDVTFPTPLQEGTIQYVPEKIAFGFTGSWGEDGMGGWLYNVIGSVECIADAGQVLAETIVARPTETTVPATTQPTDTTAGTDTTAPTDTSITDVTTDPNPLPLPPPGATPTAAPPMHPKFTG